MKNKTLHPGVAKVLVHPCVIDDKPTLVYERGLASSNKMAYGLLKTYSDQYNVTLLEDRRKDFIAGVKRVKDAGKTNLLPILLLTGILATVSGITSASDHFQSNGYSILDETEQAQVVEDISLDSDVEISEQDLMHKLLDWLSLRTPFDYNESDLPGVQRGDNYDLVKMAFSEKTPTASDASMIKIFGLYNFKTNTIYLRDDIDLKTVEGKAIFLHELVHYLQYQNEVNLEVDTIKDLEALAYMLESTYLSHSGYVVELQANQVQ